jgi:hypothetical protein
VFRAIVWKEIREQGLISLTLLVLGSAVMAVAATQAPPGVEGASPGDVVQYLGLGRMATLMLAVTAGMVCGSAVFAAEREAGTMTFLVSLPTTHARLWRAKLAAGLALTMMQVIVLLVVSAGLDLVPTVGWAVAIALYSLLAFVWGLFGSTVSQSTLGSVGMAVPAACVTMLIAAVPVMVFFSLPGSSTPKPMGGALFLAAMFAVPLALSAWFFTRPDRLRNDGASSGAATGLRALCWMARRQTMFPSLVLTAFALVFGLSLLAPGVRPFLVWPGLALLAGTIAGVLTFADEQSRGSSRFWSEQRLPLGRFWFVKIVWHMLLAFWLLLAAATPLIIRAQFSHMDPMGASYGHSILASIFLTPLFDELGSQGWRYLALPAVYGFAAGHLCGLMFRKLVVACAVACLTAGAATLLVGPSLLTGGEQGWQLWLPPLFMLATGRGLIGAWSADRLATRRPLGLLVGGSLTAVLLLAAGIAYRVVQVPLMPGGDDDIRYVAQLTPFEENIAGRDFKNAAMHYADAVTAVSPHFDKPNAEPPPPQPNSSRRLRVEERLEMVPHKGWPANDANLEGWLQAVYEHKPGEKNETPWHKLAFNAVSLPLGIYEHPQLIGPMGVTGNSLEYARRMSIALLARGLLFQSRGDSAAFIPAFQTVLTLARTMRNGSVVACLSLGVEIERLALMCLNRWLEALPPQASWVRVAALPLPAPLAATLPQACETVNGPDQAKLIRTAMAAIENNTPAEPFDPTPQYLAERYVIREALKAPTYWLPQILGMSPNQQGTDPVVELVAVAWSVPWERERTRRLIGLGFEAGAPTADHLLTRGRPGANTLLVVRNRTPADVTELDRQIRTYRRAMLLRLAIRMYRAEHGEFPSNLQQLVTSNCLSVLPLDPYDESRTFGYRISEGEVLRSAARAQPERIFVAREELNTVSVPPGQPIIWSVGPDQVDQGGLNLPGLIFSAVRTEDIVFLVPMGPCH